MRIAIIGAGPGGYIAAFSAARRGAEVTLIESSAIGGTCLNCGCIPTKTLKASADLFDKIQGAPAFGIKVQSASVDMKGIIERKRRVVAVLGEGLRKTCAKLQVRYVEGCGRLLRSGCVRIDKADGTSEEIISDKVILALGAAPLRIPAIHEDGKYIMDSSAALEMESVPERLIVVGGGVIGCELAGIFSSLGSKVTIVEGQERLLPVPSIDEAMSKLLLREMKKKGVRVELYRTVSECEVREEKVFAKLGPSPFVKEIPASAQEELILESDALIVAVGRAAPADEAGLKEAGIELDHRGYIIVDEYLQTNLPDVYAIGDILGPQHIMLAHVASAEAEVAVENCFGGRRPMNYDAVPAAVFTTPEIGTVGLTESQATSKGLEVVTSDFSVRELGKAQAMGELSGSFKLIAEKKSGTLLGAHLAGVHASDIVAELTAALKMGATAETLANTIHAHPTVAEGVFEAACQLTTQIEKEKS